MDCRANSTRLRSEGSSSLHSDSNCGVALASGVISGICVCHRNGVSRCGVWEDRRSSRICGGKCRVLRQCRNDDCSLWVRVRYWSWFAGHADRIWMSSDDFGICWHTGHGCFVLGEAVGSCGSGM